MRITAITASNDSEKAVLDYLEANASDELVKKINNGVVIEKDGKRVRNKKTLDGFAQYAEGEARKLAGKGARSTYIDDPTVYGWAIHYFEEDSIHGTLENEDGTPYVAKTAEKPKKIESAKKETAAPKTAVGGEETAQEAPTGAKLSRKEKSTRASGQFDLFDIIAGGGETT